MAEKQESGVLRLTEPCFMCATLYNNGGYTPDCDRRCAYAYFKKERDEVMGLLRKIDEKVREREQLIRGLSQ